MTVQPARAAQDILRANVGPATTPIIPRLQRMSLTVRLFLLVTIAVLPALGIQAYNEYDLRRSREADIRDRVVQITKQFGEEMGELREGARQLLIAVAQLQQVKKKTAAAKIAKKLKRTEGATRQKAFSIGLSLDSRS